jgi:Bacterial membrane protein YfhO
MRRWAPFGVGFACLLGLLYACFGSVLFRGEQFAFRDAGHFYYPLYLKVQQEWNAGRVPLWSPEENSGMPLLGNPTAAVLYPGKLIYALLPYAWGARLYIIAHVLLAVAGMYVLMRSWGISQTGSGISALSYAFSGPVLFQYCNVIFLVGAAWVPFGLRYADRWLRLGERPAIIGLAFVLAMQVLGGEPQSAYLVGLCAAGYALGLYSFRRAQRRPSLGDGAGDGTIRRRSRHGVGLWIVLALMLWTAATLAGAWYFPSLRYLNPRRKGLLPIPVLPWIPAFRMGVLVAWGAAGLWMARRWLRRRDLPLGGMLAGLACSALLGGCLAGAQLLPVLEFSRLTVRAADEGTHEIYPFSLTPTRCVEWLWPNISGRQLNGHSSWISALTPNMPNRPWVPTLYGGGLAILLALTVIRLRDAPEWHYWLVAILIVSFLLSLGEFGGPLGYARRIPQVAAWVGPNDPLEAPVLRFDGHLRDGDGSLYWLMATALPGFRSFRYPAKLLTFTALALSALAGVGWDRGARVGDRRAIVTAIVLLVLTAVAAAAALPLRGNFEAWLAKTQIGSSKAIFGPFQVQRAWMEVRNALLHGMVVYAGAVVALWAAARGHRWAGVLAIALLSADLAVANSSYIYSIPQARFEEKPRLLRLIEEAEIKNPSPGPYRVHRMPYWHPPNWLETYSPKRIEEFTLWERATIQPKYAIPYGLEYTVTQGVAELFDYQFFFAAFQRSVRTENFKFMNLKPGEELVYFTRRGFDLWNSRYFVLPRTPANDEKRGIASFLSNVEHIYPPPRDDPRAFTPEQELEWVKNEDWRLVRNKAAYPRAWIVHQIRYKEPIKTLLREERKELTEEMLFPNDFFWNDRSRILYDPHEVAWVEAENHSLEEFNIRTPADPTESVRFLTREPQRVEMEVDMKRPGLVVLADVNYPGWRLTIDGVSAPILKTNLVMRGAAVQSGKHRLVYTYQPTSFYLGLALSAAGAAGVVGVAVWARRRRNGLETVQPNPESGAT